MRPLARTREDTRTGGSMMFGRGREGGAAGRQTAAAAGRRRRGEARGKAADTEVRSAPRRAARLFQTAAEARGKAADTEVRSARARPARRQPPAA